MAQPREAANVSYQQGGKKQCRKHSKSKKPRRCVCSSLSQSAPLKRERLKHVHLCKQEKNISMSMHLNQAWYLHGNLGNAILITNIIWDMINTVVIKSELCDSASCQCLQQKVNEAWHKSDCATILYEIHHIIAKLPHFIKMQYETPNSSLTPH